MRQLSFVLSLALFLSLFLVSAESQSYKFVSNATSSVGLAKIELFVDNSLVGYCDVAGITAICTKVVGPLSTGTHTYYAKAIDIRGTANISGQASFFVANSDFSLSANPSSGSTSIGGSVSSFVNVTKISGSIDKAFLYCEGLPAGASCSFSQNNCINCLPKMDISTSLSTPPGNYSISVSSLSNFTMKSIVVSCDTSLASDIKDCGNLVIKPGVTLTTNGYSIICSGTFNNSGRIVAGRPANGGAGGRGGGTGAAGTNGQAGGSFSQSYGGSGGAGGYGGYGDTSGGNGGYTIASGGVAISGGVATSGQTPAVGYFSDSVIAGLYLGGMINYLSGAGGGGGGGGGGYYGGSGGKGGSGSYGVYIQADRLIAGTIITEGENGASGPSEFGQRGGGCGGGGGGGSILLAYGNGGYVSGSYMTSGGYGSSCAPSNGMGASGSGGAGNVILHNYLTPPVPVIPDTGSYSVGSMATEVGGAIKRATIYNLTVVSDNSATTKVTISPSVAPNQDVDIIIEFNSSAYRPEGIVKLDLVILPENITWNLANGCWLGGTRLAPVTSLDTVSWPFGTISEDGHFKIATKCRMPAAIKPGAHILVAIPTIY